MTASGSKSGRPRSSTKSRINPVVKLERTINLEEEFRETPLSHLSSSSTADSSCTAMHLNSTTSRELVPTTNTTIIDNATTDSSNIITNTTTNLLNTNTVVAGSLLHGNTSSSYSNNTANNLMNNSSASSNLLSSSASNLINNNSSSIMLASNTSSNLVNTNTTSNLLASNTNLINSNNTSNILSSNTNNNLINSNNSNLLSNNSNSNLISLNTNNMLASNNTNNVMNNNSSNNANNLMSRLTALPDSSMGDFLASHTVKTEIKHEDRLDTSLDLPQQTPPPPQAPPPVLPPPAPPEPQHTLPHPPNHAGPPPSIGPPSLENQCAGPSSVGSHSHSIGPPSIGPPSIGPPSIGPPSIGPPSIGPPSIGPPSVGPPSVGPPSVGSSGVPSRPSSVSCASVVHPGVHVGSTLSSTSHMVSTPSVALTSQEEEVNRISAMLQKEVEAFASKSLLPTQGEISSSTNQNAGGNSTAVTIQDIVEAQGLAGGVLAPSPITTIGSNTLSSTENLSALTAGISLSSSPVMNNAVSNHLIKTSTSTTVPASPTAHQQHQQQMVSVTQAMGSVPVPMSHMSIATLNQIQADLLATVSESDLNAVLNATPDNNDLSQSSILANNSQCYLSDNGNIQFGDQTAEQLFEAPSNNNLGNQQQTVLQQHYSNDQLSMPVLEQIAGEVLAESQNLEVVPNAALVQTQYPSTGTGDMLEVPVHSINFSEVDKISQCPDELSSAVNSITQLCQQNSSGATGLEPQFVGFLQQQQQPPTSTPSPAPSPNLTLGASPTIMTSGAPNSQGITVVIGSGSQMTVSNLATPQQQSSLNMPTLAATLKKPTLVATSVATPQQQILSGANNNSGNSNAATGIATTGRGTVTLHHATQHLQTHQQQTTQQPQQQIQQIHIHPQPIQQQDQVTQLHQPHYQVQQTTQQQHLQTQVQQTHIQQTQPTQHLQSHQQHHQQTHIQTQSQGQQTQQHTVVGGTTLLTSATLPTTTTQQSPTKKSSKKKKPGERKLVPLKDREYNPEQHCGVVVAETGKPCTRSLTCKTHSLTLRRAVTDRSKKFDELLLEHKQAKEAQQKASRPPETAANQFQVSFFLLDF